MLTIIDRYFIQEVLKTFLAIFVVVLIIVLVQGYVRILAQAAVGAVDSRLIFSMVGFEVIEVIGPVTPPAFFFAILYTLGRMYRNSEVTALAASGVGTARIFRAYLMMAVPLALVVALFTMGAQPWAKRTKHQMILDQRQHAAELTTSVAGRFNEYSQGDLVFYIEEISEDKTRLRNVFVQNRQKRPLSLITADEGYRYHDPETNSDYIVLTNGRRYAGNPGQADYIVGNFDKYAIRIEEAEGKRLKLTPYQMPTGQLIGSDDVHKRSEFQFRLMLPVSVIVFTLISIPLSRSLPRQGMYGGLIIAILLYAIFFNLQAISGTWMENGVTPLWLGRWWVHIAMLSLTLVILVLKSPGTWQMLRRRIGLEER